MNNIDYMDRFNVIKTDSEEIKIAKYICPYCNIIFDNNGDLTEHSIICKNRLKKIYKLPDKLPILDKQKSLNDFLKV